MNRRTRAAIFSAVVLTPMMMVAGCGQQQAADAPQIEEKQFALKPVQAPIEVDLLRGTLGGMIVTQRAEKETGRLVYGPTFRADLKLTNSSEDQAVRLIAGEVRYLDAEGRPIAVREDRGDTGFTLSSYQTERLDPGMQTTRSIDLPFPVGAVQNGTLRDIRLELEYVVLPYRKETTKVHAALSE
jgi:hypothetical protein